MSVRSLFVTRLYEADIGDQALLDDLARSIRSIATDDAAGVRWSREHGYRGYTSYASLNDLPKRDPAFTDLGKLLTRHAVEFGRESAFSLARRPRLDSLWVNLLKSGGQHSGHIHPHSIISGTLYVEVPSGSGDIRFEDPRLPLMMAAPVKTAAAAREDRQFIYETPKAGTLLLWESWLRHEVPANPSASERITVSFNYRWA
jgi:uncharacterized protein (TIGR02466 family)